jgi:hypothetical protein
VLWNLQQLQQQVMYQRRRKMIHHYLKDGRRSPFRHLTVHDLLFGYVLIVLVGVSMYRYAMRRPEKTTISTRRHALFRGNDQRHNHSSSLLTCSSIRMMLMFLSILSILHTLLFIISLLWWSSHVTVTS